MGAGGITVFVIFGVLNLFGAMFVCVGALFAMVATVGAKQGPLGGAQAWLVYGVPWAAFAVAWLPYALWVRRSVRGRVAAALPLFEDGTLVDGTIVSVDEQRTAKSRTISYQVTFAHEGKEMSCGTTFYPGFSENLLREGATAPVLYLPGHPMAATFAIDGAMRIVSIRGA